MRRMLLCSTMVTCLLILTAGRAYAQQGGGSSTIPSSFFGMTVFQHCDMTDNTTQCPNNPSGEYGFPAMPFGWTRTLSADGITWNTLERCDPTGNWCPVLGSGCASSYSTSAVNSPPNGAGGFGTDDAYTNANGASVTCLRPSYDSNPCNSFIWCTYNSQTDTYSPCVPSSAPSDDPSNCAYAWNVAYWYDPGTGETPSNDLFDDFVGLYNSNSVQSVPVMFTLYLTPDWLSIQGSRCTGYHSSYNSISTSLNTPDTTCYAAADTSCGAEENIDPGGISPAEGGCEQPYNADAAVTSGDLGDGTGTDLTLINFMKAMFTHLYDTGEYLSYIEIWNEANICSEWNHSDGIATGGGSNPCNSGTGTGNDLARMAADVRSVVTNTISYNLTGTTPLISSPAEVTPGSFKGYLAIILNDAYTLLGGEYTGSGVAGPYDVIGFHGYYTGLNPDSANDGYCTLDPSGAGAVSGTPGVLTNCPVPEAIPALWTELYTTLTTNVDTSSSYCSVAGGAYMGCNPYDSGEGYVPPPVMDTEFSWSQNSNVVNGGQREALAARSYLLQAQFYPQLTGVDWFGEDATEVAFNLTSSGNGSPNQYVVKDNGGGTGEFWSPTEVTANEDTDTCTTAASTQGGYLCLAGQGMEMVEHWLTSNSEEFVPANSGAQCTCSNTADGSCGATPPTGTFICPLQISGNNSYFGEILWDNTNVSFPCSDYSTSAEQDACGTTSYTLPSQITGSNNPQMQYLSGATPTSLSGATSIYIGAKPLLIENQQIQTAFTPTD